MTRGGDILTSLASSPRFGMHLSLPLLGSGGFCHYECVLLVELSTDFVLFEVARSIQ